MEAGIRIGRILGIPVHLHPTWFLVLLMVLVGLWNHMALAYPAIPPAWRIATALMTSALLFASVLMHELGHSVMALRNGVAVRSIVLFIFGGVAWMEREADSPGAELRIAAAGPAVNAGLAALFAGLAAAFPGASVGRATFAWLAALNLGIALFNLLPGFPLDGGRVLRALLWARGRDVSAATAIAARVGQGIAYAIIAAGLFVGLHHGLSGIWLAFIGWLVLTASMAQRRQAAVDVSLRGLVARDAMSAPVPTVDADLPVTVFAREHLLAGERWAIVLQGGVPRGLVSRDEVRRTRGALRRRTTVGEIATPLEQLVMATPDLPLADVLHLLSERRAHPIPVMEDGLILGAVTREDLLVALDPRRPR